MEKTRQGVSVEIERSENGTPLDIEADRPASAIAASRPGQPSVPPTKGAAMMSHMYRTQHSGGGAGRAAGESAAKAAVFHGKIRSREESLYVPWVMRIVVTIVGGLLACRLHFHTCYRL